MSRSAATSEPMSPMDLLLFRGEHDARRRATACAILVLDGRPEWDDVCLVFERASREFLRLRQHVVEPSGGLGPARWVTDPDFDLLMAHMPHVLVHRDINVEIGADPPFKETALIFEMHAPYRGRKRLD